MNTGADTADQMVKESIQIAESAAKLAALGAKNLAAIILALLSDQKKWMGKTNLKNVISEGTPAVFDIQKRDLKAFEKEAKKLGILYYPVVSKNNDEVQIVAREENMTQINKALKNIGYGPQGLKNEEAEKNANPRALSTIESTERGNGLESSIQTMNKKQVAFSSGEGKQLQDLEADGLASLLIALLMDASKISGKENLLNIVGDGKGPVMLSISSHDLKSFEKEMRVNSVPLTIVLDTENSRAMILAPASEIKRINLALERLGYN